MVSASPRRIAGANGPRCCRRLRGCWPRLLCCSRISFRSAANDAPSLAPRQIRKPHRARQQVQRGGQPAAGREIALAAFGADEVQRVGAIETVVDAGAAAEVEKLGAAAHRNVLTVIDRVAGFRVDERTGAAAERLASLEQFDTASRARRRQRPRRGPPARRRRSQFSLRPKLSAAIATRHVIVRLQSMNRAKEASNVANSRSSREASQGERAAGARRPGDVRSA